MIATRDPVVAARARTMRTHGLNRDAFNKFSRVGRVGGLTLLPPASNKI